MSKILVVDDDVLVRQVVGVFLEREGHAVTEAADGLEALDLAERDPPDIVIADIRMPRLNGLEMMLEMRRRHPDTPVIMMSGSGSGGPDCCLLLARDMGAAETFAKPLDMHALISSVDRLVRPADA